MTSRERVLTALNHKEPDRVPLDLGSGHACKFTKYFYEKLLDYFGIKEDNLQICQTPYQLVYASDKVMDLLKCDVRNARLKEEKKNVSPYVKKWADDKYSYFTNSFGTTYRMPLAGGLYYDLCDSALAKAEDARDDAKYIWPIPEKFVKGSNQEVIDYRNQGFLTTTCQVFGNGFLQTGPLVWGYEDWFMMMVSEPERCTPFIDTLLDKKIEWYGYLFEEYDNLLDVTAEADDFGTQRGTFCSPKILTEIILPYHKKLNEYIKKAQPGIKTTLHTCGSVTAIIPDIIQAGYDCLNPVQIAATDMEPDRLKKSFGDDLVFWGGGINTQATLPNGTIAQVKDETKRNLDIFAPGGGYVFSPVHNIQDDVPIENFMAMWETFQEYCKY